MGRIIYNPKEKQGKNAKNKQAKNTQTKNTQEAVDLVEATQKKEDAKSLPTKMEKKFDNVRQIGDVDSEYKIYLEDYVYTYLYQYAAINLTCEQSAVFLGKFYEEKGEVIISGIIPIPKDKLSYEDEWISKEAIESIEEIKNTYFSDMDMVGWMHMQPGYGTMLTMKEIKAQQQVFGDDARILLLMDPINKIETFFVYEEELYKEQLGYIMYYERNEAMQRYMLEHPFVFEPKEVAEDAVVNQFREIGKIRKKQYQERKKTNFTVVAASVLILALAAVVVKLSDQGAQLKIMQDSAGTISTNAPQVKNNEMPNNDVKVIIDTPENKVENNDKAVEVASKDLKVVDNTKTLETPEKSEVAVNDTKDNGESIVKEGVKESVEEEVKEAAKEEVAPEDKKSDKEVALEAGGKDYKVYVIQEGDTLRKISQDHFQTEARTKDIIEMNGLENGDKILVGEEIKIPLK